MTYPVITVSELNGYIKTMFDSELMMRSIYVAGEISNLSVHARTGHMYFSLKDENASLKAVMFASDASSLGFVPENGSPEALEHADYIVRSNNDGAVLEQLFIVEINIRLLACFLFDYLRSELRPVLVLSSAYDARGCFRRNRAYAGRL